MAQVLAGAGGRFQPDACWPATIDGERDQLLAVQDGNLVFVTDAGLRVLPWPDISRVEASDAGGLQRSFVSVTGGQRHSILQYGPNDRADFYRLVPEALIDAPSAPAASPTTDESPRAAGLLSQRPSPVPVALGTPSTELAVQALSVAQVLDVLAVLALIGGTLLTIAAAVLYATLAGLLGFLVAALLGAVSTASSWAMLRLGSVVGQYVAVRVS